MPHDTQLQKGGNLLYRFWNHDIEDFQEEYVEDEDLGMHIYNTICFAHGVTLKDLFLLINRDIKLFAFAVSCPFLADIVEEALSPVKENKDSEISGLGLRWIASIDNKSKISNFLHFMDFHGISKDGQVAVEFCPLNALVRYPFILNTNFSIRDVEDGKVYLNTNKLFTLLDVVKGVLDELASLGPPGVREWAFDTLQELNESSLITEKPITKSIKKNCSLCKKRIIDGMFDKPQDICIPCFINLKEN